MSEGCLSSAKTLKNVNNRLESSRQSCFHSDEQDGITVGSGPIKCVLETGNENVLGDLAPNCGCWYGITWGSCSPKRERVEKQHAARHCILIPNLEVEENNDYEHVFISKSKCLIFKFSRNLSAACFFPPQTQNQCLTVQHILAQNEHLKAIGDQA